MLLNMLKAKIHQAMVTEANLNYIGSITIDNHILQESNILVNEKVQVVNINTGARIETYVISGEKNSGVCCLNGAAARLFQPGDKIIIMSYCYLDSKEAQHFMPKIVVLNDKNQIIDKTNYETAATAFKI